MVSQLATCSSRKKITAAKSCCASYRVYPHPQETEISIAWETCMISAAPFLCVCHVHFCSVIPLQAVLMTNAFAYWSTFVVSFLCCNTSAAVLQLRLVTGIEVWSRSPDSCVGDLMSYCLCWERLFTFFSFCEAFLVYPMFRLWLFQWWLTHLLIHKNNLALFPVLGLDSCLFWFFCQYQSGIDPLRKMWQFHVFWWDLTIYIFHHCFPASLILDNRV